MKNRLSRTLIISLTISIIAGYSWLSGYSQTEKTITQTQCSDNDFKELVLRIIPIESSFHEHYELARKHQAKVIKLLEENQDISQDFKNIGFQHIKKTQHALQEFKNIALRFNQSKNFKICEVTKEYLTFCKYANVLMEQHFDFMSNPLDYISSDENLNKFTEYTTLTIDQYEYLTNLLQIVAETESVAMKEKAVVALQYTDEETKAMEKWKEQSIDAMIFDAMNGDAAGLYMVGLSHLYGGAGFPINIKEANRYFAASATLGFAPALDKIKFMYLEDDTNPWLALVYNNLTIAFGHKEFIMPYHDLRKNLVERGLQAIANEIEKIAIEKLIKIHDIIKKVENTEDKAKIIFSILFDNEDVVSEDSALGETYWKRIITKE